MTSGGAPSSAIPDLARRLFDLEPDAWLRRVPGRETFAWPPERPVWVVKRSRGGAPFRDRAHEWLRGRRTGSPGQREFTNLQRLAAAGVPVPRALAWAEDRARRLSLVVMESVAHTETLRERLASSDEREHRRWLGPLVALAAGLHGRGWYHRDLYLQHLVPAREGAPHSLVLLDVGRARRARAPGRRWLVKDIGALLHSTPPAVSRSMRLRFLARYLDAIGVHERRQRRAFARAVEARRRRMAAHVPRHGEPSRGPS